MRGAVNALAHSDAHRSSARPVDSVLNPHVTTLDSVLNPRAHVRVTAHVLALVKLAWSFLHEPTPYQHSSASSRGSAQTLSKRAPFFDSAPYKRTATPSRARHAQHVPSRARHVVELITSVYRRRRRPHARVGSGDAVVLEGDSARYVGE